MRFFLAFVICINAISCTIAQNVGQKTGDTTALINYTDIQGNRQGKWIRKYDSGKIAYI